MQHSPHLPNTKVWRLVFDLVEYLPSDVADMTGVSTDTQRDWRRRGIIHKQAEERHARYTIFEAAELLALRLIGEGRDGLPAAIPHAPLAAMTIVKMALMERADVWGGVRPDEVFDALPDGSRSATSNQRAYEKPPYKRDIDEMEKREWIVDHLMRALGSKSSVRLHFDLIVWPTGKVELSDYNSGNVHIPAAGMLDRPDPIFDGMARVVSLRGVAANLARRSRLPFLSVQAHVNPEEVVNRPEIGADHGTVEVRRVKRLAAVGQA